MLVWFPFGRPRGPAEWQQYQDWSVLLKIKKKIKGTLTDSFTEVLNVCAGLFFLFLCSGGFYLTFFVVMHPVCNLALSYRPDVCSDIFICHHWTPLLAVIPESYQQLLKPSLPSSSGLSCFVRSARSERSWNETSIMGERSLIYKVLYGSNWVKNICRKPF